MLIGPAGTGKGVVIDAAARAEQPLGRDDVRRSRSPARPRSASAATAPALAGRTLTLDALVARASAAAARR